MALVLTSSERTLINDTQSGAGIAMRLVVKTAQLMGAPRLIPIQSAHIDGALYHGASGTLFAEKLVETDTIVKVRSTLNVGALDLTGCSNCALAGEDRAYAARMMRAYIALGCEATWTCAPYQAGHRPSFGADVAWGESNAVVFCNSVLGARTNRYGDFLDIACAIVGRAPDYGLHQTKNRIPQFIFDVSNLAPKFLNDNVAWPILGHLFGSIAQNDIGLVVGVPSNIDEDKLKAFGAASASSGAVGLFHIEGVTPEAREVDSLIENSSALPRVTITAQMVMNAQANLSTIENPDRIDAVAIGSPHLSMEEFIALDAFIGERSLVIPFYACTGRHVISQLKEIDLLDRLEKRGVTIVGDTCVVVTPILKDQPGILMTNSGKFAHYAPGNTGYSVVYGGLSDCVESAITGRPHLTGVQKWQS